jgi:5-formyltetrahydrofolate cyclo-ligase
MELDKKTIRKTKLKLREQLAKEDIYNKSRVITQRLIETDRFVSSNVIMCYINFKNEVDTNLIIKCCMDMGKTVALPRVTAEQQDLKVITPYIISDAKNDLGKGSYGIFEPIPSKTLKIDSCDIDLVIVPGVAFDFRKYRIGYGAGFYDRFLKTTRPDCLKVGFSFEIQIIDNIPCGVYDIPMDMVITENRIL